MSKEKDDEIWAINVVSLFISLLENLEGISEAIPSIIQLFLKEL